MTGLGIGPRVVDEMDTREVDDLMAYWIDNPPAHVALVQLRDVVIAGLGGKPPSRRGDAPTPAAGMVINGKPQTPEQFAAMLGVKLPESA